MQIPGLDFGQFIAFILPGFIVLYALSLVSSPLQEFLLKNTTQANIGIALIVVIIALATGRVISIGRAALIDPTFGVALPLVNCHDAPYRGSIEAVAPDYRQMIDAGHREAYLLTVAGDQRQYQFCGNAALAALIYMVCALIASSRKTVPRRQMLTVVVIAVVFVVLLYAGARVSYYSFMRAVAQINSFELVSLDGNGQPCRAPMTPR